MGVINKQSAIDIINVLMVQRIHTGKVWGTDGYPEGSNPAWFYYPVGQPAVQPASNLTGSGWSIVRAQEAMNSISYLIGFLAGIVKTRIVIYKSGNGPNPGNYNDWTAYTTVVSDQTAVAGLDMGTVPGLNGAYPVNTQVAPFIVAGRPAKLSDYQAYTVAMVDRFLDLTRNGAAWQLSNTICHSSCHSNCHGSRNRR
jgi:hypothetical protein